MTLEELCIRAGLRTVTGDTGRVFHGVYAGDLLSRAMSHIRADELWLTIMNNTNVIAVASLTEAAAVLLAEDVELIPEAMEAAKKNGITVLSSPDTVYELCRRIGTAAG